MEDVTDICEQGGIKLHTLRPTGWLTMRVWGAMCCVQPLEKLRKLDARSRMCFFIGYKFEGGGYRVCDPRKGVVVGSRDVVFNEDACDRPPSTSRTSSPPTPTSWLYSLHHKFASVAAESTRSREAEFGI